MSDLDSKIDYSYYEKEVRPYIDRWISQGGRNDDMRHGAVNFMTGQGLIMLRTLITTESIQLLERLKESFAADGFRFDKGPARFLGTSDINQILEAELTKLRDSNGK